MKKEMFEKHYDALRVQKQISAHTSQLAEIGKCEATNLFANGNFTSTSGVTSSNATASAASNKLRLVATGTGAHYGNISMSSAITIGHTYYARGMISGIVGKVKFELYNRKSDGNYESASQIVTSDCAVSLILPITSKYATPDAGVRMWLMNAAGEVSFTAGSEEASFGYINLLDLTDSFGTGSEPTAAQMAALLAGWTNSWFGGTVNLAQADKLVPYLMATICDLQAAIVALS